MPVLSVVVPTYNEAGNIGALLREIDSALAGLDYELLVIDDDSPDGTHERVAQYARENPRVVPVRRTNERGLATAVIEGLRRARGEYVVVMDSDFQHPPATVSALFGAALRTNADLVVGSRYAPGGTVHGFPWTRRLTSWGAKALAVLALARVRHFGITDPMSGFFLVRRAALDVDDLRPRGYKILIEILARGRIERATEVGFAFHVRRGGESKLGLRTQWDYFWHVVGLGFRDRENHRLFWFAGVGISGTLVNLAAYEGLKLLAESLTHLVLLALAAVAREASILWNFTLNDRITFRDLRLGTRLGFFRRAFRFNLVSLVAFAAYLGAFAALLYLGVDDTLGLLLAILLTFVINYRGNRRWTYARAREPPS